MIGTTVGKYRIVDKLGRGGMGTVYKAVDQTLDREVAIKVLNPDLTDADVLKRFRGEAVTLARLNHAGIATIYELHHQDDELLMVMEFVRGETFHDLSDRLGPLAPPQAAHLCMQVLDALGHAHRGGVVHRDLKPANLMITEAGAVKVMDFGIARVLGSEHFTHGGYMMGTPAYMAPEQVLGREIDGRADLYSVGVVLYRLLTGKLPFSADTAISMVQMQISEPPTPILTFRPDLPDWCSAIVDRALSKSPSDRFQSAEEFRGALAAAVTPQAIGEMPTLSTPTPPGLTLDPDITAPHRTPTALRASAAVSGGTVRPTTPVSLAGSHGSVCAAHADQYAAAREDHDCSARPDASCSDRRSARDRCSGHRVPGLRGAARRSLRIGAADGDRECDELGACGRGGTDASPRAAGGGTDGVFNAIGSSAARRSARAGNRARRRGSENSVRRRNWFGAGGDWRRCNGGRRSRRCARRVEACWTGNEHRRLARRLADRRTRDCSCDQRRRHHTAAASSCP